MKDLFVSKELAANNIVINKQIDETNSLIDDKIEELKTKFNNSHDYTWNGSILQVLFRNETSARKYRVKIEKFLKDLLEEDEEFIVYHPSHSNSKQEFEDDHHTFQIDKVKCESPYKYKEKHLIPHYSSHFEDFLNCDKIVNDKIEMKEEKEKSSKMTCFNCLGNHHMKKCPEKLDRIRINANKKDILQGSTVRYHTDEQNNSVEPGVLSDELRTALGLRNDQLPQFIYHMRVIGYPPGWMDEAVFEKSGLSLYDSNGKTVTEGYTSQSERGTFYDGTKFIEFPGFNSPVPNGIADEWKILNMPPLQSHQQLKEALKCPNIIISSNIYKRREFPSDGDIDFKKQKNEQKPQTPHSNEVSKSNLNNPQQSEINFVYKTPDSKLNKHQNQSVSISPGTPILEQGNLFQKLPDPIKFSQGITEHLPFENLPDAVGTYEKMRGVINCVQKKLNDIKSS